MSTTASIKVLQHLVDNASDIVVLTGAGMSTESGIPDFRSSEGVWQNPDLVCAMSDDYLRQSPRQFWPKFKQVFMHPAYLKAEPNAGHQALSRLERMGKRVTIFTQNVDGLHQLAGSSTVFEMHGSVRTATCPVCRQEYGLAHILAEEVPTCHWINQKGAECGFVLSPDTVLFGQDVRHFDHAVTVIQNCDLLLVLGTSLMVDPVAELPNYGRKAKVPIGIVNLEETYLDGVVEVVLHEKIGEVLPQVLPQEL